MAKRLSEDTINFILTAESSQLQQEIHKSTKAIQDLESEEKRLRKERAAAKSALGEHSKEYKKLTKSLKETTDAIDYEKKKLQEMSKQLGVNSMSMSQLRKEAKNLQKALDSTSKELEPKAWQQYADKLREVKDRMEELKSTANGLNLSDAGGKEGGGGILNTLLSGKLGNLKSLFAAGGVIGLATVAFEKLTDMAVSAFNSMKQLISEGVEMAREADGIKHAFDKLNQPDLLKGLREATHGTVTDLELMKAAVQAKAEGICQPVLLGNEETIEKLANSLDLNLEGIDIVNLRHPREQERRERYARILTEKRQRDGYTFQEANDKMFERNYFGMMMVETGEADAFITGLYTKYSNTIKVAKEVIGIRPEYKNFGTMHIINSPKGTLYISDTLVNANPTTDMLVDIAKLSATTVRFFNEKPTIAMVSHSNFGSDGSEGSRKVRLAVEKMQEDYPDLVIDGEIQLGFALDKELRDNLYPFTRLKGKDVNTLIFPNLTSARSSYKMLQALDADVEIIGPIQMGLNKPIHFTDFGSSVRDVVNITAVAVIDAYVEKIKNRLNGKL